MVLDNIRFSWRHTSVILGESLATVTWDIPSDAIPGTYCIQHFGYHKELGKSKSQILKCPCISVLHTL